MVLETFVENDGFFNSYMVPMELCNIMLTAILKKTREYFYGIEKE